MRAPVSIKDVQRETARFYKLPVEAMWERDGIGTRAPERSHPRQAAMYLAHRLTRRQSTVIARRFNRDHSTVLYSIRAARLRAAADAADAAEIWIAAVEGLRQAILLGRHDGFCIAEPVLEERHAKLRELVG